MQDAVLRHSEVVVARFGRAGRDHVPCGGRLQHVVAGERLDDEVRVGRLGHLGAVVAERRVDHGLGRVHDLGIAHVVRDELSGLGHLEGGVAQFRPGGPAVLVVVAPGVEQRVVGAEQVLEAVLHHVEVGHDLAHVVALVHAVRTLEEVVGDFLSVAGTGPRRAQERIAVQHAEAVILIPGDLPFLVDREAVVVRILVRVEVVDVVELLPPVGQAVVVVVGHALVRLVVRIVGCGVNAGHDAAREVDLVRLPRRHRHDSAGRQRVVDLRPCGERGGVGAVFGYGPGFPPVGQAVVVGVVNRGRPGVGGAVAVPEVGAALCERAAERQEVGAAHEERAVAEADAVVNVGGRA